MTGFVQIGYSMTCTVCGEEVGVGTGTEYAIAAIMKEHAADCPSKKP